MGQGANSGRNASLDEKKDRSAGRRNERGRDEIRDAKDPVPAKGKTGGAKGKDEQVNKAGLIDRSNATQRVVDTGSSTKRARKR